MRHNSREVSDFCWGICLWEDLFSKWKVLEKCRARDDAPSARMSQFLAPDDGIEEAKVQAQDTLLCGWLMAILRGQAHRPTHLETQPKLSGMQWAGGLQHILISTRIHICLFYWKKKNHQMGHLTVLAKWAARHLGITLHFLTSIEHGDIWLQKIDRRWDVNGSPSPSLRMIIPSGGS